MWVEQDRCGWSKTNVGGARQMWVEQNRCGWSKIDVGSSDGHLGGQVGFKKLLSYTLPFCRCSVKMSSDPEQQYENVLQPPLTGVWGSCCLFSNQDRALWRTLAPLPASSAGVSGGGNNESGQPQKPLVL